MLGTLFFSLLLTSTITSTITPTTASASSSPPTSTAIIRPTLSPALSLGPTDTLGERTSVAMAVKDGNCPRSANVCEIDTPLLPNVRDEVSEVYENGEAIKIQYTIKTWQ